MVFSIFYNVQTSQNTESVQCYL